MGKADQQRGPPWAKGLKPGIVDRVKQQLASGTPLVSIVQEHGLQDRFDNLREWLASERDQHARHAAIEAERSFRRLSTGDLPEMLARTAEAVLHALASKDRHARWMAKVWATMFDRLSKAGGLTMQLGGAQSRSSGMTLRERQAEFSDRVYDLYGFNNAVRRIEMPPVNGGRNGDGVKTRRGLPLPLSDEGDSARS